MGRHFVLMVVLVTILTLGSTTFAAGWAFTVDTPLSYTFDNANVNKPNPAGGGGVAALDNRTTGNVSGSKVLIIAPFHVGAGYEDYSVSQNFTLQPGCVSQCTGKLNVNFQIIDLVIDIPLRYLNIGLGYGSGTANADVILPPTQGGTITARNASVSQTFVTLGIPLGNAFDVHIGYHWVSVEEKDIGPAGSPPDQLLASGEMLSAGLRLNF